MRSLIIEKIGCARPLGIIGDFVTDPILKPVSGPERGLRSAAVLVPLVEREEGLTVLFTKRTDHLRRHAGQISFPGGRVEAHDEDAVATALRETEEEVGLSPSRVDVVGLLDEYQTGTGFSITPVVGFVRPGFTLRLDEYEVAEAFEVPFGFLMNPDNHQRHKMVWKGRERQYHAMPFKKYYIWGATAGMLVNLYERIRG